MIFFSFKGIIPYHSYVETSKQDSIVERKHQHMLNVTQALFFQSYVPLCYWGDCVLITIYLINHTPSPLLSKKAPFELSNNKKPTYAYLRTFGCLCYGSTLPSQHAKFTPRAQASVFFLLPFWL